MLPPGSPRRSGVAARSVAAAAVAGSTPVGGGSAASAAGRSLHSAYALQATTVRGVIFCFFVVAGFMLFDATAGSEDRCPPAAPRRDIDQWRCC